MERVKREKFCVINVKYKEISWRRVRKKKEEEEKNNFYKHRGTRAKKVLKYIILSTVNGATLYFKREICVLRG